ncbi:type IV pilin protein [Polyangium mundeleinium]|uniref:Prepilin-type N-terminal cleavage/methylation domain-containing protein n=1 Tax=Polyangium mundeleinium TaxID=2995306 RepID=A0ABT5EYZ6_9BACT|nr:prepilin-type N-terminal cleavage/methylation domain-containing protein [Polyangium mundeleinium]MDC0747064.1 prepilin-type N-terminal cleavage/methylation domain-containing protein [Polyangium mundeleinium]
MNENAGESRRFEVDRSFLREGREARIAGGTGHALTMDTMQFGERPRSYAKRRGFTLAELMIVVAMIGVLAAIGMVGYRRYMRGAAASEVKAVVSGIRIAEEAYKAETFQYLGCSTSLTAWYPDTPNDKKRNWDNGKTGEAIHDCFMQLNVTTDGPVRFGYAVVAGIAPQPNAVPLITYCQNWKAAHDTINGPWFIVQAAGNQDADLDFSLFASSSLSGEICVDPKNGDDE